MKNIVLIALMLFSGSIQVLVGQSIGTEIGNKAPEIRLPSLAGDTIALSSLQGKMVLLDFWATWCPPCVKEQPALVELYKKYRNAEFVNARKFEIFGVSLDSKKANWQDVVNKNAIEWIQVSDLKFWSSPVAKLYNIPELPFNLLIDGQGVILAKNIHGEELEKELARYLVKE